MKSLVLSIFLVTITISSYAQIGLYLDNTELALKDGVELKIVGDLSVNMKEIGTGIYAGSPAKVFMYGNLITRGKYPLFARGDFSHFIFGGTDEYSIAATENSSIEFHKLSTLSGKDLVLNSDIKVNDTLTFHQSFINLNGHHIKLNLNTGIHTFRVFGDQYAHPYIRGEDNISRFKGEGYLSLEGDISSSLLENPYNFGNLGFSVQQNQLGHIKLRRSHAVQPISGGNSIGLYYDVLTEEPINNNASIGIDLKENTFNEYTNPEHLEFFSRNILNTNKLNPDSSWMDRGITGINNNTARLDGQKYLYPLRWTLYECDNPDINLRASAEVVCVGDTIFLEVDDISEADIEWSTGETTNAILVTSLTAKEDSISVKVSLPNGCFSDGYVNISFEEKPTIVFTQNPIKICENDQIVISPDYQHDPSSFLWSTGDTSSTISYVADFIGDRTVTVTAYHSALCYATDSVVIETSDDPEVDLGPDSLICDGSTLELDAGAGDNYSYLWKPTSSKEQRLSVSESGTYSVSVTDENTSCSTEDSVEIRISNLFVTRKINHVSCSEQKDGSITINIQSGTSPYDIMWNTGDTTTSLNNISGSTYSVSVTDAAGCRVEFDNIKVNEPKPISISSKITADYCRKGNGRILITPLGGTPPYRFIWTDSNDEEVSRKKDLLDVLPGIYTLKVVDKNGCNYNEKFEVLGPENDISFVLETHDIQCASENDGAIIVTNLTGGIPPYEVAWSTGVQGLELRNVSAGTYSVTVTDSRECLSERIGIEVRLIDSLYTEESIINPSCIGVDDGKISVRVIPETKDLTFSWSNGSSADSILNLGPGTYTVTIVDGDGCSSIKEYDLIAEKEQTHIIDSIVHVQCYGDDEGKIFLSPRNTLRTYTYDWDIDGPDIIDDDSLDQSSLKAGVYTLTITGSDGCIYIDSFDVYQPDSISQSASYNYEGCGNNLLVDIHVEVIGGEPPFSFNWSSGETSQDVYGLSPGTYTLRIIDNEGCSSVKSYKIEPNTPLAIDYNPSQVRCKYNPSPIDINIAGGIPPYEIFIDSRKVQIQNLIDLPSGSHGLKVVDSIGCMLEEEFVLPAETNLDITAELKHASSVGAFDGSIELIVSGGSEPYQIAWSNGESGSRIEELSSGIYVSTVTEDSGCWQIDSFYIDDDVVFDIEFTSTHPDCGNGLKGVISLDVDGSFPPFKYMWSGGETSSEVVNLDGGSYVVTITDDMDNDTVVYINLYDDTPVPFSLKVLPNECGKSHTGSLKIFPVDNQSFDLVFDDQLYKNVEDTLMFSEIMNGTYVMTTTYGQTCNNIDSVNFYAGDSLSIKSWVMYAETGRDNGTIFTEVSGGKSPYQYEWSDGSFQSSLHDLPSGNYDLTVTDALGCEDYRSYYVPSAPVLSVSAVVEPPHCNSVLGMIDQSITGGIPPYTFEWDSGQDTEDITDLIHKNYSVTVTDSLDRSVVAFYDVPDIKPISIVSELSHISCYDGVENGSIAIEINGGQPLYQLLWDDGDSSLYRQGLSAGSYELTVTDNLGCQVVEEYELTQPDAIMLSINTTPASQIDKNDGSASVLVEGGTPRYSYIWSNNTFFDSLENVGVGTYYLTIVDQNGCTAVDTAVIEYLIGGSDDLAIIVDSINVTCKGYDDGLIDIEVEGGVLPYSYRWSNGSSTQDIDGLIAGSYSVTVTDDVDSMIVREIEITEPKEISISLDSISSASCGFSNGFLGVSIMGGTSPYSYEWSNGFMDSTLSFLSADTYGLTATDFNGCEVDTSFEISESDGFTAYLDVQNIRCFGARVGRINVISQGAIGAIEYEWNTGADTKSIEIKQAAEYSVTVSDESGCTVVLDTIVSEPEPLGVELNISHIGCDGNALGAISLDVSGGTEPYTYLWSQGDTSLVIKSLEAGDYAVTITDMNNCSITASGTVELNSQPLEARFLAPSPVIAGDTVQFIDLSYPLPDSWNWYFDDAESTSSQVEDPQFVYKNDTTITESLHDVILVVSNGGCIDSLTKTIRVLHNKDPEYVSNRKEPFYTQIEELAAYPVPASEQVFTAFVLNKRSDVVLNLFDPSGVLIETVRYHKTQGLKHQFDTQSFSDGLYFIRVQAGEDVRTIKIVIHH